LSTVLTEQDARRVAIAAAEEVLARRPVPSAVTLKQAAEMLGISPNTARKLNLQRNATGLIPYEAVLAARDSR
jgi:predicted HTH domain antitoxin